MAKAHISSKRIKIDKAQATVVGIIAGAVFVTVFSLVSAKALWTQNSYQVRIIDKKQDARDNLESNLQSVEGLQAAYKIFVSTPTNVIGGNPAGTGEKDGDNARITLDALPSKYDFPALTTSLEKILVDRKFKIDSITGIDDELAQSTQKGEGSPVPIEMPFQISVTGSYSSVQDLLTVFEKSIRPFNAQKLVIKADASNIQLTFDAKTYYQPEKGLNIKLEDVK